MHNNPSFETFLDPENIDADAAAGSPSLVDEDYVTLMSTHTMPNPAILADDIFQLLTRNADEPFLPEMHGLNEVRTISADSRAGKHLATIKLIEQARDMVKMRDARTRQYMSIEETRAVSSSPAGTASPFQTNGDPDLNPEVRRSILRRHTRTRTLTHSPFLTNEESGAPTARRSTFQNLTTTVFMPIAMQGDREDLELGEDRELASLVQGTTSPVLNEDHADSFLAKTARQTPSITGTTVISNPKADLFVILGHIRYRIIEANNNNEAYLSGNEFLTDLNLLRVLLQINPDLLNNIAGTETLKSILNRLSQYNLANLPSILRQQAAKQEANVLRQSDMRAKKAGADEEACAPGTFTAFGIFKLGGNTPPIVPPVPSKKSANPNGMPSANPNGTPAARQSCTIM